MNLIFSKYSVFLFFSLFLLFRSQGRPMIQLLLHLLGFCWQSCDITTGSKDQSVKMGTYDANEFLNVGDVSRVKRLRLMYKDARLQKVLFIVLV